MTQQTQKNTLPSSGGMLNSNTEPPKPRAIHFGKLLAQIVKDLKAYEVEHTFVTDGWGVGLYIRDITINDDGEIVEAG